MAFNGSHHVFVYGSLMYAPVWGAVVKGQYQQQRGAVHGYARYAVPGETYPAMVKQHGASVQGLVWLDVWPEDLTRLDQFEGIEYQRDTVQVVLEAGGTCLAHTYVWKDPLTVASEPWDVAGFEAHGLARFLAQHVHSWEMQGKRK